MAPITMEVKIISCKDLKAFNFFQKLSVYATVSITTQDSTKEYQQQKTLTDTDGDGNPEWNHKAHFDLSKFDPPDLDHLFLDFDFVSQGGLLLGEKSIGQVRVPITDLLEDSSGALRFVSYQVVTSEGNPNGVLDFSYKVVHDKASTAPVIQYPPMPEMYHSPPEVYYPPPATSQVSYPPVTTSDVFYPPVATSDVFYPPVETCYPPPVTSEAWYPPQEAYYSPPAHFPTGEEMHSYYPLPPTVYPAPPTTYGSVYEESDCSACPLYPTVDPFRPYNNDTWRNNLQSG